MKSLAIITARGGSKRIFRKNIKLFNGFPIIKYSIIAALDSGCFDEVMVSTDDKEIADLSLSFGASVPFYRSASNSDDFSTTADVIEEVILQYKKNGKEFSSLCCIYPTAPFVNAERLTKGMNLLMETGADCVLPVVRFGYPIQRALEIENGKVQMIWPEHYLSRSQDLSPAYHDSGQFYCMKTESLLKQKKLFAEFTIPMVISEEEVQDIDTEEDWKLAELKYQLLEIRAKKNGEL